MYFQHCGVVDMIKACPHKNVYQKGVSEMLMSLPTPKNHKSY